jgi:mRNA-degrading endonuclease RelE of RelBE toxin-antitoxin system
VYEKNLRYGSAFILRLDKSYRLAYQVDFDKHVITLLRVGDHKTVGSKE